MLAAEGEVFVCCPLEEAWALFNRVEDVALLIPSVEEVVARGDEVWARVAVKLGILPVTSQLMLRIVEREAPRRILAEGWSFLGETLHTQVNPAGMRSVERDAKGRLLLSLELTHDENTGVRVVYRTEVEAYGRLRNIYQSILRSKAPAMMDEFGGRLRTRLEGALAAKQQLKPLEQPI